MNDRNKRLSLRLTFEEYECLRKLSAERGKKMEPTMRELIMCASKKAEKTNRGRGLFDLFSITGRRDVKKWAGK